MNPCMETTWEVTLRTASGVTIHFAVEARDRKHAIAVAKDWNPGCRIMSVQRERVYS